MEAAREALNRLRAASPWTQGRGTRQARGRAREDRPPLFVINTDTSGHPSHDRCIAKTPNQAILGVRKCGTGPALKPFARS